MTDHEQKRLTADCWRLFMFPLFIRPTVNTTQNIWTRWWIKINNIRTARSAAASRFPTKGNWNWDVPTVHSFPHPFKLPPSSILSFLHVQLFTFPTTSAAYRTHTHISSFHLLCSVCRGPAVTNQASNGPCKNQQRTETWWDGGWGGVMEVERSMERLRNNLQPQRDQSVAYSECLSICAAVGRCKRGSQWKKWCVKRQQRCRGSDCVQEGTEMYEWIMSQHLASNLSAVHIKVHFSNGLFTKWALAVFISLTRLLCFKHLSLRQKWTLLLSLCSLQNTFHFHLHSLLFVSVAPLYHPSLLLWG